MTGWSPHLSQFMQTYIFIYSAFWNDTNKSEPLASTRRELPAATGSGILSSGVWRPYIMLPVEFSGCGIGSEGAEGSVWAYSRLEKITIWVSSGRVLLLFLKLSRRMNSMKCFRAENTWLNVACWSEITRDGRNMWHAWMRARRAKDRLQGNNVTRDLKQRNWTIGYWLEQSGSK